MYANAILRFTMSSHTTISVCGGRGNFPFPLASEVILNLAIGLVGALSEVGRQTG